MLVDTHAHLSFPKFEKDLSDVIARAQDVGVSHIVDVGTNLDTSRKAIALAESVEGVFASAGHGAGYFFGDCIDGANYPARCRSLWRPPGAPGCAVSCKSATGLFHSAYGYEPVYRQLPI